MNWWAVQHRKSAKSLDGARRWYEGGASIGQPYRLFHTKGEARLYIRTHYGYMATRKDLRAYPHGGLMPRPARVVVDLRPV